MCSSPSPLAQNPYIYTGVLGEGVWAAGTRGLWGRALDAGLALVLCRMSQGMSKALCKLLSACRRADQVAVLHTLGLHPGLINERWAGEEFSVAGSGRVNRGEAAIMVASAGGNEALVQELVKRGAEVNARSEDGLDALMLASELGRTAVVAMLLNHGADPNTRNEDHTALGLAASEDHLPICLLLVARAADLYAVNAVYLGGNALEGYGSSKYSLTPPPSWSIKALATVQ